MIRKYGDIISGIAILIFSIVVYINTYTFKMITVSKIGSDFMPKLVAALIAVLAISIILNGVKEAKRQATAAAEDASNNKISDNYSVILSFIAIAAYIALLESLGFIIMTAVYLFAQMFVLTIKSKRKLGLFAILSVLISAGIYALFVFGFQLILPTGILG